MLGVTDICVGSTKEHGIFQGGPVPREKGSLNSALVLLHMFLHLAYFGEKGLRHIHA